MKCPYADCNYETDSFPVIKKITYRDHVQRGHVCPECKRSFVTEQRARAIPFYKKELYNMAAKNG